MWADVQIHLIFIIFLYLQVMEAASASDNAWEIHRAASVEFEEKQRVVQVLYNKLTKHILKSR